MTNADRHEAATGQDRAEQDPGATGSQATEPPVTGAEEPVATEPTTDPATVTPIEETPAVVVEDGGSTGTGGRPASDGGTPTTDPGSDADAGRADAAPALRSADSRAGRSSAPGHAAGGDPRRHRPRLGPLDPGLSPAQIEWVSPGFSSTACESVFSSSSCLKASRSVSIGGKVV